MTGEARIIVVTAFELDRNYIQLGMPVYAPSLLVHRLSKNVDSIDSG